jgi:hypothetical protein
VNVCRRSLLVSGAGLALAATLPSFNALAGTSVAPGILRRALAALDRHGAAIPHRDVVALADFSQPSRMPRFHIIDLASGSAKSYLVAHGRGSDPGHTGWLQRFSNAPGSYATASGAYRTDDVYVGKHGRSIRLAGLEASNDNAMSRAIVVHGAWYVSPEMARTHGVLGRSEGCFALATASLPEVLERLGPGRLIYADKV